MSIWTTVVLVYLVIGFICAVIADLGRDDPLPKGIRAALDPLMVAIIWPLLVYLAIREITRERS